jgi:hypothetical protein
VIQLVQDDGKFVAAQAGHRICLSHDLLEP